MLDVVALLAREADAAAVRDAYRAAAAGPLGAVLAVSEDELVSSEAKDIGERIVTEKLGRFFEEHPSDAREIAEKAVLGVRARDAARKAREMALRRRAQKMS